MSRVIIAGSRGINDLQIVYDAVIASGFTITSVLSGTARGVDKLGEYWAHHHNIAVQRFPANWGELGKSAGYTRNALMADNADKLILIWDGHSPGSKHMLDIARKKGLKIYVHTVHEVKQNE